LSGFDWGIVRDAGIGIGVFGVFLIGIAALIVANALKSTLERVNKTLDEVDKQLDALGVPVSQTLGHVEGIAGAADSAVSRLTVVVDSIEGVAGSVNQTTGLVKDALSPAIINLGATLTGISAGLRRLFSGNNSKDA
jgi:uncharacterized protein YoxC